MKNATKQYKFQFKMIRIFWLVMFLIVLPSSNVTNVIKPASHLQQREKSVRFVFSSYQKGQIQDRGTWSVLL